MRRDNACEVRWQERMAWPCGCEGFGKVPTMKINAKRDNVYSSCAYARRWSVNQVEQHRLKLLEAPSSCACRTRCTQTPGPRSWRPTFQRQEEHKPKTRPNTKRCTSYVRSTEHA
eukprot:1095343-Pyramimonas_sp.AAC.2